MSVFQRMWRQKRLRCALCVWWCTDEMKRHLKLYTRITRPWGATRCTKKTKLFFAPNNERMNVCTEQNVKKRRQLWAIEPRCRMIKESQTNQMFAILSVQVFFCCLNNIRYQLSEVFNHLVFLYRFWHTNEFNDHACFDSFNLLNFFHFCVAFWNLYPKLLCATN